ncbi:sensor histidine kinase [Aliihoeflea sp. PC F10.4]
MKSSESRSFEWMGRILGSCDRLVAGGVTDAVARERHARLLATQLAAPFFLAAIAAPAAFAAWGANMAAAAIAAIFAVCLANVLLVASGTHFRLAAWVGSLHAFAIGTMTVLGGAQVAVLLLLALAIAGLASWVAGPGKASRTESEPDLAARMNAVVLRMTNEGEVLSASHQARSILRLDPDILTGAGLFGRVRVSDRVKLLCALANDGDTAQSLLVTLRIPGDVPGDVAYLHVSLELLRDATDWTVILRDASDVGELQVALDDAMDEAAALDAAKSRFLAAVSHELRTPLNAIIGFSEMLLHQEVSGPLPAKQAEHVTLIREAGSHLLSIVNSILDVSKIEAGAYAIHPEPFEMTDAIDRALALLDGQAAERGVTLANTAGDNVGELNADQRAVHQILLNLVSNAIKFTPQGGSVSVSASRMGERMSLVVADTGIGIAAADLDGLCKPFAQVHNDYTRKFEGTGLGLSLVKGLVALHDGDLSIESAPGQGTTVTVQLPLARDSGDVTKLTTTIAGNGLKTHGTYRKIA